MVSGQEKDFISRSKEGKSHMRVTVKFEEQPVSAFRCRDSEIPSRTFPLFPSASPECGMVLERAGHVDPNPHLSPSRILGPLVFRAEDDGCVASTGPFPTHINVGNKWSKDDHLARKRYAHGGRKSLGQRCSMIHAGQLSLHERLALQY